MLFLSFLLPLSFVDSDIFLKTFLFVLHVLQGTVSLKPTMEA